MPIRNRRTRRAILFAALFASPLAALAAQSQKAESQSATPLLNYAISLSYSAVPNEQSLRERLDEANYLLSRYPPPDANCARMLGAARFAALLENVGDA